MRQVERQRPLRLRVAKGLRGLEGLLVEADPQGTVLLSYSTTFDGCAYGLRSVKNGKLIRKPWRVVTDYFLLTQEINTARLVLVIMVIRPVKAATRSSRARTPCD